MPDLLDTGPIPDDAAYWDALAARVAAGAVRHARRSALEWFARTPAGWVAASLLVVAAFTLLGPGRDESTTRFRSDWTQVLAPKDDVGRAIMVVDGPPAIGALLLDGRREAVP